MKIEKSQPEGQRIMSETRFTEFPALFVDPRVGISDADREIPTLGSRDNAGNSVSETDD